MELARRREVLVERRGVGVHAEDGAVAARERARAHPSRPRCVLSILCLSSRAHALPEWRKPPHPVFTADYATYVQIITWFLDDPSPLCPFSVHRMALVGKQLGVKVGQWFGPSTAAGAIKCVADIVAEDAN